MFSKSRLVAGVLLGSAVMLVSLGVVAAPAGAVTVGDETALRAALADLTETSIVLSADVSVTCAPGELLRPAAAADLLLDGAGFTVTQTCAGSRVLRTESTVELRDVTITGGDETASSVGGGVFANADITLTGVAITGNQVSPLSPVGGNGGGLFSNGTTVIIGSTISNNTAAGGTSIFGAVGGGISGNGAYTVTDSTISDNTAGGGETGGGTGGAAFGNNSFTFIRSTISGNTAGAGSISDGGLGGATATNGAITLISSTVVDNEAQRSRQDADSSVGGVAAGDELVVVNSTVVRNSSAAGGANLDGGSDVNEPAHLVNSVIALPLGGSTNCGNNNPAANMSGGHNYSDDASCALDDPTDVEDIGVDPLLGTLAPNGGPTQTLLPAAGSPLLDVIPPAACQSGQAAGTPTDQRSLARPQGAGCDIGAVELCLVHPFSDVPAWVGPAVDWAYCNQYMDGYPDNLFKPNDNMTRAQVARLLYRLAGLPPPGPLPPAGCGGLTDVPAWAEDAICWLVNEGYATGYDDDTFRPDNPISRGQVTRMLFRVEGSPPGAPANSFTDVPDWIDKAVDWITDPARTPPYATGYTDNTYRPDNNISRAENTRMTCRINTTPGTC